MSINKIIMSKTHYGEPDVYWQNTVMMLNGNGTNGQNTFTDLCGVPKILSVGGDAQVSTSIKKYGTGSIKFDGVGDYIYAPTATTDVAFGTGDFTIECWVYVAAQGTYQTFFSTRNTTSSDNANAIFFGINTGTLNLMLYTTALVVQSTSPIAVNTWTHCAVVRYSGIVYLYLNGIQVGSAASTTNYTGTYPSIGMTAQQQHPFNGYIDELRVTNGVARYISNFTPGEITNTIFSSSIDPYWYYVSMLVTGNGTDGQTTFTDLSPNPKALIVSGDARVNASIKKYGSGSIKFDGTGDMVSTSTTTTDVVFGAAVSGAFSSGDFTIECWVYVNTQATYPTYQAIFSTRGTTATSVFFGIISTSNIPYLTYFESAEVIRSSSAITTNTWNHCVLVRHNAIAYMYINGIRVGSAANTTNYAGNAPTIGATTGLIYPLNGYIDELRVTNTARYKSNFSVQLYDYPLTYFNYDPFIKNNVLLLNGDGTDGQTTFTDLSYTQKTVTASGTPSVSAAVKKYGTGSINTKGTPDYLLVQHATDFQFGTNDCFTVEFWTRTSNVLQGSNGLLTLNGTSTRWAFFWQSTGKLGIYNSTSGTFLTSAVLSNDTWYHYAAVKNGGYWYLYINGVLAGSAANIIASTATACCIGATLAASTTLTYSAYFNGYFDDIRITKGVARYVGNFTPPPRSLPIS